MHLHDGSIFVLVMAYNGSVTVIRALSRGK